VASRSCCSYWIADKVTFLRLSLIFVAQVSALTFQLVKGKLYRTVDVAVKTMKQGQLSPEEFLNEAKLMSRLRHRNLVLLTGVCTQIAPYYIITELMANGSLLEYLRKDTSQMTLTHDDIFDMAAQVQLRKTNTLL
jgi:serine/threonine protein kinase